MVQFDEWLSNDVVKTCKIPHVQQLSSDDEYVTPASYHLLHDGT